MAPKPPESCTKPPHFHGTTHHSTAQYVDDSSQARSQHRSSSTPKGVPQRGRLAGVRSPSSPSLSTAGPPLVRRQLPSAAASTPSPPDRPLPAPQACRCAGAPGCYRLRLLAAAASRGWLKLHRFFVLLVTESRLHPGLVGPLPGPCLPQSKSVGAMGAPRSGHCRARHCPNVQYSPVQCCYHHHHNLLPPHSSSGAWVHQPNPVPSTIDNPGLPASACRPTTQVLSHPVCPGPGLSSSSSQPAP